MFFDEGEVRKTIAMLKPNGQLFECRIINGNHKIRSGYFTDADKLISALRSENLRDSNVYITLQECKPECYNRKQHDRFMSGCSTTSDDDVLAYQWLFVDLDPIRMTDTSSSDEDLAYAGEMAVKIYRYLRELGFNEPIKCASGNGYHLLYAISLANTDENISLVKRSLETISCLFSDERCNVDVTNHNPSRICKLHGTLAQKGFSTETNPHRMSRILTDSMDIVPTKKVFLEKLCAEVPEEPEPIRESSYSAQASFDLDSFLSQHGIGWKDGGTGKGSSRIMKLDHCPFNASHMNGDAKIFHYGNGAISFKCQHKSCLGKVWQDVRRLYEPNAYDWQEQDRKFQEAFRKHNRDKANRVLAEEESAKSDMPMFRTAAEIMADDEPEMECIPTGIEVIDKLMHGFEKQAVSVISGLRGSGKSTLIGTLICNAVDYEHCTVVYSGELASKKYLNWIMRMAAGPKFVQSSRNYENSYDVPAEYRQHIIDWMGDYFWLYDNRCGNSFTQIQTELRRILSERKADLCIIDNLMALDLSQLDRDKYEAQTRFILVLKEIAIETNTHIVCVAHPKKSRDLIRLDDISGTSNLGNAVDNAFMVHRNNHDFAKKMDEWYGKGALNSNGIPQDCSNVIEIAKDRENGTMDCFIPLWYEPMSKRLLNTADETKHYGWEAKLEV